MKKDDRLMDAINCSPTEKFTQIPNDLLRNPDLSGKAKAILCILLSNKHGWRSYIIILQKMMREGRDAIRSGIRELEKNDYLRRIRYRDAETKQYVGMFWAYANAKGQFNVENHMNILKNKGLEVVKPRPENPPLGKSAAENSALKRLSNKKTKKKNINKRECESEKNLSYRKISLIEKEKTFLQKFSADNKSRILTEKILDILNTNNKMQYTQSEIRDHLSFIRVAKRYGGHILINGLGLGVALTEILKSENIKNITVIEKSKDVINLVAPSFQYDKRVNIINADAFTRKPPKGIRYTAVWHDIWDNIGGDNLPEMTKLHRKYGKRTDWQGSWAKELCKRH